MRYNATIITKDGSSYTGEVYRETETSIFICIKKEMDVSYNSPWWREDENIVSVNYGIPIRKDRIKELLKE